MDAALLDILRCPLHPGAGPLAVETAGERPDAGPDGGLVLTCPHCGREYLVAGGIAVLLTASKYPGTFREQEMKQWDEQAERYDRRQLEDPIYMAGVGAAVRALDPRPGELVLDAACGTGLTTRAYLRPGVRVVALDLSLESLKSLKRRLGHRAAHYVQADCTALPFADAVFDKVLCANVIQHLPGERLRLDVVRELARVARPGARVVVTAHNFSIPKRRAGWTKEGTARSPSGEVQYIYRFDPPEFSALLASALRVERVRGAGLPLPYRLKLSWLSRRLEKLLCRFRASAPWGNMLYGVGCRQADPGARSEPGP